MCGIVGAVAQRDVVPILVEGLHRLEYRGYDSAGVAVLGGEAGCLERTRMTGKVAGLEAALAKAPLAGSTGIAHTRWATHGPPSESNAHPHLCRERVGLVHNGIIENFEALRAAQDDHEFDSDTDTEVVVHRVHDHLASGLDLLAAVQATVAELEGAYALGVVTVDEPGRLVAARRGSPLVIGLGIGENFIASDVMALLPVTQRFMFLEEGDIADLRRDGVTVYDATGSVVEREVSTSELAADAVERGHYRHYMIKEIHEQPRALADTLEGRAAPATTQDWWHATGWRPWPGCRAGSRSRASSVTGATWSLPRRSS
jgi:glucosamine--fructose-6-phosphate aminotransferase (isomerizing)